MNGQRFSWRDVVTALLCGLVVLSVALVKISHHRELARAETCSDNLKSIGLAIHNYHSAFKLLPINSGGTSGPPRARAWQSNADRLSVWIGLLPFMQQQALWEKISNPYRTSTQTFPSMGPVPWYDADIYQPWSERPSRLVCPNDRGSTDHPLAASYVLNYGDAIDSVGTPEPQDRLAIMIGRVSKRGMFMSKRAMKFRDILDGLANTLMISESKIAGDKVAKDVSGLVLNPSLCLAAHKDPKMKFWPIGRGAIWTDGIYRSAAFQTILP
ncbi:MAG: DUF1559 domain-containing protein, partial [Pirellulaceae bacterium]|nr:DUF1559 domain-containing protein [Pirellulaceae bacterium]